ncbi:Response regulator [Vibrio crassostreae]|uniref:response regulator n=1 Tax=Vibrio crassostreae TaxID=246167 RepID=UPI0005DFDB9F|nr:response regulator [Vibrio crassostreae]ROQ88245.1 response regulator receiver domain-containing protein [Vibrio crassostreae]ROR70559.1 response regulator receiver domain-containing protein [Vibrio crassostreae]ROR87406.1 response regulator receiver domain-containing protein [Vibrio crassostreae]RPF06072.1 response regulator receiver domain-containing protein [Vibrio crassostreae]TCT61736.1 response regulator receiver domain-containing protein [Vibrio crassostreae]
MKLTHLNALIVDDSSIVLSTIRNMLVHIGFSERLISIAKSPRIAMAITSDTTFDVIICDYNFGNTINGKQLFEELKQSKRLKDDGIFILVTGENSALTIRPILELRPDNYLLKPFNRETLKQRITSSLTKKSVLQNIYKAECDNNYEQGLKYCEELIAFHPEYFATIQQFKGSFLSKLKLYEQAKRVYESALDEGSFDWAQAGLANSLANLGRLDEAQCMIESLIDSAPTSTLYQDQAAQVNLISNKVPDAIVHFKLASELTPGNSERELAIANLCLSVNDSKSALAHYQNYIQINRDTFRDTLYMKLNHIRFLLYCASDEVNNQTTLDQVNYLISKIPTEERTELKVDLALIAAHIAMESKQYQKAVTILTTLHDKNDFNAFPVIYHHTWLLDKMSCENEFKVADNRCGMLIIKTANETVISSQMTMSAEMKRRNTEKMEWLKQKNITIKQASSDYKQVLGAYLDIHKRCPMIKNVCMNIVKLLSVIWPDSMGAKQVLSIIQQCDEVITQLYTLDELTKNNYQNYYRKALLACKQADNEAKANFSYM